MIDLRYVKKLVDMLDESTVDSIEISSDKGMKIRISKTPSARQAMHVAPPMQMPMVGTYYASPEPGAKPYVTAGSAVVKGQVLCIIEAMKIMNEIECEVTGTIKEVCVTDAHPVEYGQVLFRIDPNG